MEFQLIDLLKEKKFLKDKNDEINIGKINKSMITPSE